MAAPQPPRCRQRKPSTSITRIRRSQDLNSNLAASGKALAVRYIRPWYSCGYSRKEEVLAIMNYEQQSPSTSVAAFASPPFTIVRPTWTRTTLKRPRSVPVAQSSLPENSPPLTKPGQIEVEGPGAMVGVVAGSITQRLRQMVWNFMERRRARRMEQMGRELLGVSSTETASGFVDDKLDEAVGAVETRLSAVEKKLSTFSDENDRDEHSDVEDLEDEEDVDFRSESWEGGNTWKSTWVETSGGGDETQKLAEKRTEMEHRPIDDRPIPKSSEDNVTQVITDPMAGKGDQTFAKKAPPSPKKASSPKKGSSAKKKNFTKKIASAKNARSTKKENPVEILPPTFSHF